eukprot:2619884-Amphidinium_carterae.2
MILVEKAPHIKLQHITTALPRLLSTVITVHGHRLHIVSAHAPTRDSPEEQHRVFQDQLIEATSNIGTGDFLIVGIDLNARLGGLHQTHPAVGMHTTPIRGRTHVTRLLSHCDQEKLYFTNTLLPPYSSSLQPIMMEHPDHFDEITTWRKPKGGEQYAYHQIDFIIANDAAPLCLQMPSIAMEFLIRAT